VRAENPDVVLPEEVKPELPRLVVVAPPAPETTAPELPKPTARAILTWRHEISILLERNKQFPGVARARLEEGVVQLAFSLDREGHVTASRIVKSSGYAALDNETLDLLKRINTFPPPPPGMPASDLDINVPIRFNYK
jgi:periplasmic protein TonB